MKDWSRFYTPKALSDLLMSKIENDFNPKHIIDLCAGSCNLLKSGLKKWPDSIAYASDIEKIKSEKCANLRIRESKLNALDTKKIISLYKRKERKLIVANPPFGVFLEKDNMNIPKHLKLIYKKATPLNRIESLITIANLSILNKGDYFAAILPENLFSGAKFSEFTLAMLSMFDNIQLEKHSLKFEKSEVRTRIFVGKFKGQTNLSNSDILTQKSNKINSSQYNIIRGIDNSKLKNAANNRNDMKVVHFNNAEGNINQIKLVDFNSSYLNKKIRQTDILILRVGRNAGRVIKPDSRHIGKVPSDLIILLRDYKRQESKNIAKLELELLKKTRGLTTKYVGKTDIISAIKIIG